MKNNKTFNINLPDLIPFRYKEEWMIYDRLNDVLHTESVYESVEFVNEVYGSFSCLLVKLNGKTALVFSFKDIGSEKWKDEINPIKGSKYLLITVKNENYSLIDIRKPHKKVFRKCLFIEEKEFIGKYFLLIKPRQPDKNAFFDVEKEKVIYTSKFNEEVTEMFTDEIVKMTSQSKIFPRDFLVYLNKKDEKSATLLSDINFYKIDGYNDGVVYGRIIKDNKKKRGSCLYDTYQQKFITEFEFKKIENFQDGFSLCKTFEDEYCLVYRNGTIKKFETKFDNLKRYNEFFYTSKREEDSFDDNKIEININIYNLTTPISAFKSNIESRNYGVYMKDNYVIVLGYSKYGSFPIEAMYDIFGYEVEDNVISKYRSDRNNQYWKDDSKDEEFFIPMKDTGWRYVYSSGRKFDDNNPDNKLVFNKTKELFINSESDANLRTLYSDKFKEGLLNIQKLFADIDIFHLYSYGFIDVYGNHYWCDDLSLVNEKFFNYSLENDEMLRFKEERNTLIYVNYNSEEVLNNKKYPILVIPSFKTIIKSYYLGKTKRRGFKEAAFQSKLEIYFGDTFNIIGNARLNTGNNSRAFEPDIALIGKYSLNIRIDIEIDEPYAAITRLPTHCRGEDEFRDIYFKDRGWIVLRFTEKQVHSQEMPCLKFIDGLLVNLNSTYENNIDFIDVDDIVEEEIWDIKQAQYWELDNFREQYLNHYFNKDIDVNNEEEVCCFNVKDKLEESKVVTSFKSESYSDKLVNYNKLNYQERDNRIKFFPHEHLYLVDQVPYKSASTVISKYFPEFDSYNAALNLNSSNPLYGMDPGEIVGIWEEKRQKSAQEGTKLHENIENHFLYRQNVESTDFNLFLKFLDDFKNLEPFRTEWRIYDEESLIAGTADMIVKNGAVYDLYDWKRSKKVVDRITGEPISDSQFSSFGVGALSYISDTSYNKYSLQLGLYRYILEKNYDIKIGSMNLVILHPQNGKYHHVEVNYEIADLAVKLIEENK